MLNFLMSELIKSTTAQQHNINNTPTDVRIYDNMLLLIVKVLQPLRNKINKPMIITSGYRCFELNKIVGGALNSHHTMGQAVDFCVPNMTVSAVVDFIRKQDILFTQLIEEHGKAGSWVHISYDKNNLKNEVLIYKNGKYVKI